MMDIWEQSNLKQYPSSKRWEDEDVDEEVVDNWDQVSEEEEEISFPLPQIINKSKEKKTQQQRDMEVKEENGSNTNETNTLSIEELRKLQIEADLHLAKEIFGVDQTTLNSKEDYDKFKEQLVKVLNDADKNSNFSLFSEEVVQFLCTQLPTNELRKLHKWIGNLQIQRTKQEKGGKKKPNTKAKTRAKLKVEDEHSYDYTSFDCDDFI